MLALLLCLPAVYGLAPFLSQRETVDRVIDGVSQRSYFVIFNDKAPVFGLNKEKFQSWLEVEVPEIEPENVQHIYEITEDFRGFAAWVISSQIQKVLAYDFVKYVEEDTVISASAPFTTRVDWGQMRSNQKGARNLATTPSGLYNSSYPSGSADTTTWDWTTSVNQSYRLPNNGQNARIWIADSGILQTHQEFQSGGRSRVVVNRDFVDTNGNGTDCNGHGTHCAGSAAGNYRGIAIQAEIGNLRVLNCDGNGTGANFIAALNYASSNQAAGKANIFSASLGGPQSTTTDNAVNSAANNGLIPVVAAGNNNNANACNYSPAAAAQAITVGATSAQDTRATFSNAGSCVDVFAPGQSIHSAWYTSTSAYNTISGTSMATPLTAGAIAVYATISGNTNVRVAAVKTAMRNTGTAGQMTGTLLTGTPNLIINSNWS